MTTKAPLKYARNTIHGVNVTLKRNTLDDEAIRYFNQGQCHALAYALHKKLELPMVWLEHPFWGDIVHCAVKLPGGLYLDVTGIHDPNDFGYGVHDVPNPQAFIDSCDGSVDADDLEWAVPDMYLARHYANLVIDRYALDIADLMAS
jgi:hypothetical protein